MLQEPQGVTPHKTEFFIVTAVKTSNLTISLTAFGINPSGEETARKTKT
jgi:hypothetical protein